MLLVRFCRVVHRERCDKEETVKLPVSPPLCAVRAAQLTENLGIHVQSLVHVVSRTSPSVIFFSFTSWMRYRNAAVAATGGDTCIFVSVEKVHGKAKEVLPKKTHSFRRSLLTSGSVRSTPIVFARSALFPCIGL